MFLVSVKAGLLPTSGYRDGRLPHLVLPALTLGVAYMALLARTTRAVVLEILSAGYVSIFPGVAIFITVLGLNLPGDGLRDILDPHTTRQR